MSTGRYYTPTAFEPSTEEPENPDRTWGAPRHKFPDVGNCERCGSDRFVRTAKVNGQRLCLACEDLLKPDPMTAYKQHVEENL